MSNLAPHLRRIARRVSRREDGFTMIAAIMILFVSSLLVTVTLVSAGGDIALTHNSVNQKKAYYAALAGVSAYQYNLNTNSNYWRTCPSIPENKSTESARTVEGTTDEHYEVVTKPAEKTSGESYSESECKSGKQTAILQTHGSADGTFRIESIGTAGTGSEKATRKLVATFSHPGFLNYVYLTNYEVLDPAAQNPEPTECEHYYKERVAKNLTGTCGTIEFAPEDKINGPLHTNDAAAICSSGGKKPTFGREGHKDKIEINGGRYAASSCGDEWNMLGEFTEKGPTLTPPETDTELLEKAGATFAGRTEIELKAGTPNTMTVKTSEGTETKKFPEDGVVYIENKGSCSVKYSPYDTDVDYETDQNCGNVYVHGEYTEQLTIAAQNDVIINGNIKTTTEGSEGTPTGEGALGLIATNFVRVYHPVQKEYEVESFEPLRHISSGASKYECPPLKYTGTVTSGSEKITSMSSVAGLTTGMTVIGTGIPTSATITAISGSTITLSGKATSSATGEELFFNVPRSYKYKGNVTSGLTQVSGLSSMEGLTVGTEVTGTGIPTSTKITEVKPSAKTIVLSNKATSTVSADELTFTLVYKVTGKTSSSSTTVTNLSSVEGLVVNAEVTGSGIPAGTRITEIKSSHSSKEIVLSNKPTSSGSNIELSVSLSFKYESAPGECVETPYESGFTYHYSSAENLYVKSCKSSGDTYGSKGECDYENSSSGCDAENENKSEDPRQWGYLESPTIDAAILSTAHSFIVDNFMCGKHAGTLNIWGAIAQFWRGPVGEGEHGYTKNYNYDERLEYLQPPDFLTPTSSQLKLDRITAASS